MACNITISGDLRAIGYDFKLSGSQKIKCEVDVKMHTVTFSVPVGSLTKVATAPRVRRNRVTAANGAPVPITEVKAAQQELEEISI